MLLFTSVIQQEMDRIHYEKNVDCVYLCGISDFMW